MHESILFLSSTLSHIAAISVLTVICINIFILIRKRSPAKVNCWFCNSWIKVPYKNKNSFECTNCLQYNGFNLDGDYNKVIPEQYRELANNSQHHENSFSDEYGNGLCKICNNNQRLKVYQLANFVPLCEKNYDMEIEHFQKQLDKAYKLCKKCENVLKNTLDNQSRWLLGMKLLCETKLIKKVTHSKIVNDKFIHRMLLLIFVIVLLLHTVCETILQIHNLNQYLPSYLWPYANHMKKSMIKTKKLVINSLNITVNNTDSMLHYFKFENFFEMVYVSFISKLNEYLINIKLYILQTISFEYSFVTVIITLVFLMHILLMKKFNYGVVISWFMLIITYLLNYTTIYTRIIQIFATLMIICSLIFVSTRANEKKIKLQKKLGATFNLNTASSKPTKCSPKFNSFEDSFKSTNTTFSNNSPFVNVKDNHIFGSSMMNRSKSPSSFSDITSISKYSQLRPATSYKNLAENDCTTLPNTSFYENRSTFTDLHGSFLKLNIGNNIQHVGHMKHAPNKFVINKNIDRPRPVISPARLSFVEHLDKNTRLPVTNLSRSSSESSGFMSQTSNSENNYQTLPNLCPSTLHGDVDSVSLLSEPINQLIDKEVQKKQIYGSFYPLPGSQIYNKPFSDNAHSSVMFKFTENSNMFANNLKYSYSLIENK